VELVRVVKHDDSGAIAIVVALFAVVLFGFAALVVDVGDASDVKAQASAAADAGALAGERELANWTNVNGMAVDPNLATAVTTAVGTTFAVSADAWAACTDASMPPGFTATTTSACIEYEVTSTGGVVSGSTVRVRIPQRRVPSTFGGIFGASSIPVSPVAAATAGQDPPSPCQPCDPRLDNASGQPVAQETLPDSIRARLPKPADVAPAPPVDPQGCPTGPGLFDPETTGNVVASGSCVLQAGLYVFDDVGFIAHGSVTSVPPIAGGPGVTLVFYGSKQQPLDVDGSLALVATPANQAASVGDPIPGVAIVIDQLDPAAPAPVRSFDLGPAFDVTGSVYALDGNTTWVTPDGACPATPPAACRIRDDGAYERIAVTKTQFGDNNTVPTVASDHAVPLPPPQPEHLSE
jgi:Flp pilus assembly protein TadG